MRFGLIVAVAAATLFAGAAGAREGSGDLDRYGKWVDSRKYGEVWMPKVPLGWSPTSNGTNQQNDDGTWVWVSKDPFWSETSTSGRWLKDRGEKWVWKPGLPPAPTGDASGGGVIASGFAGPGLPPSVARARQIRYERAVSNLPVYSAPLPLPPVPQRRVGRF